MTEEQKRIKNLEGKLNYCETRINELEYKVQMIERGLRKGLSFKDMPDHLDSPGPEGPKGIAAPPGLQLLIDREEGNLFDKKNFTVEYHG